MHVFVPTALDVADGEASFFVESNGHSPGLDATLESARSVHYKDESGWHRDPEAPVGESGAFRSVTVRTMAIGAFFSQLVAASGFIAVKMDIEGSEFRLLRHLLLARPQLLCRLNVLAVEWHSELMTASAELPANLTAAMQWLLRSPECGVGVVDWH